MTVSDDCICRLGKKGNKMKRKVVTITAAISIVVVCVIAFILLQQSSSIMPVSPSYSLEQTYSVTMVDLEYTSDDLVIFRGNFGLFVYDLNTKSMIRSVDLNPIDILLANSTNFMSIFQLIFGYSIIMSFYKKNEVLS